MGRVIPRRRWRWSARDETRRRLARPAPATSAPPGRPEATNFAVWAPEADGRRGSACSTTTARETRAPADRAHPRRLARLGPRRPRRASSTASAPTGRGTRTHGLRFNPPSCCSTRTPGRSRGEPTPGLTRCSATTARRSDAQHARDSAPSMPAQRRRARRLRLGRRPAAAARGGATPSSTSCTSRASPQLHNRDPRAPARHLRRPRAPRGDRLPAATSASRAVELLPVHQFVTEPAVAARGLTNYWGYNSHRLLRPARRLLLAGRPRASRSPSSSRWSRACTRPASR